MSERGLQQRLYKQVDEFVDGLEAFNKKRPEERRRSETNYLFLRDIFKRFLQDRNKRAHEVSSPEYITVHTLAAKQFPVPPLWNLCMDGRVKTVLTNGATAGVGGSIRVPGGILREFVRGEDGQFRLLEDSNFARILDHAFDHFASDTISEIFDSHIGCAARNTEEQARGRVSTDSGLLSDVLHKKEMGEAMKKYVQDKWNGKRQVYFIQTSFDPHDGYMYMGFETDGALSVAKAHAKKRQKESGTLHNWEYTSEVIDALVTSGKIMYTKHFVQDPPVAALFAKHAFTPHWRSDYIGSAKSFWKAIAAMKEELLPLLYEKLDVIYPELRTEKKEREQRAVLLLTSAFIAYLHNQKPYPYGVHREEIVKVSEGGYPPYGMSAFVVLSLDEKNLIANIEIAASLVRQNRRESRVKDHSGQFPDAGRFVQGTVPVVVQELVREDLQEHEWEALCAIDWSDMPKNWDSISDVAFFTYLQGKGEVHVTAAMHLNTLRKRMAILFDTDQVTAGRLVSHHKVALPVVASKNRVNYFVVPFVRHGFS